MNDSSRCLVGLSLSLALNTLALGDILGSAQWFAVLGGQTVTNTGPTVVTGDLGVWPGSVNTGFPPGRVIAGAKHLGDAVAQQAQGDVTTAYNNLAGLQRTHTMTDVDLGGLTLTPGVYFFDTSATLNGALTLDAQGDPNARFIFQIGTTLLTSIGSSVTTINGADGYNVYWQVGTSATLDANTAFQGNILALASISLNIHATIAPGRALARNGSVSLIAGTITAVCSADFDRDGSVDFFDYDAFVVCFEGGSCPSGKNADFNGDGAVDFFDYDAFVLAFERGC